MMMLSRVCALFRNRAGKELYTVTPEKRLTILDDVPEEIQEDPLFDLLVADGSIEVSLSASRRRMLEQDPVQETDATGKAPKPEAEPEKPAESKEAPADSAEAPAEATAETSASARKSRSSK